MDGLVPAICEGLTRMPDLRWSYLALMGILRIANERVPDCESRHVFTLQQTP